MSTHTTANKPRAFMGYLGKEIPVSRTFAAAWIRASRGFGCASERVRVRSSKALIVDDGTTRTQFIIR